MFQGLFDIYVSPPLLPDLMLPLSVFAATSISNQLTQSLEHYKKWYAFPERAASKRPTIRHLPPVRFLQLDLLYGCQRVL